MYRRAKNTEQITLEFIDAKFDRFEKQWREDRKEEAARLAADRKETEARLERDRKEAEAKQKATETRLMDERKEAEARQKATETRLMDERKEFITQKRWLIANFMAIVVGMASIFIAVLVAIVAIVNGGFTV